MLAHRPPHRTGGCAVRLGAGVVLLGVVLLGRGVVLLGVVLLGPGRKGELPAWSVSAVAAVRRSA